MISWIEEHWPKSTIFLAVYSTILIFLFVLKIDIALFLIWIQLPIYWLHQFEEYVFPGGFMETFNRQILGSSEKDWPLSKWRLQGSIPCVVKWALTQKEVIPNALKI